MITLIDYYREIQFEATKDILKCTCQFITEKNGETKAHASGVFIKIDENYFLITAAHVIENLENDIFVPLENTDTLKLGGELTINALNISEKRDNDKIDVALLKLCEKSVQTISSHYSFLEQNEIEINHSINKLPQYISFGYPCSMTKKKYKTNDLIAKPFNYITIPAEEIIYNELNCETFKNIVVHYEKNRVLNYTTGGYNTGPDTFGISGSGLWFIPSQLVESGHKVVKKLVAILTEWPIRNRKYWIATRIDVITEIIRQKYQLNIEASKLVKININK